ncbi:UDP-N-acetylglucosamine/UDP-glucose/GDP-mannose transporter [Pycnococcus provasolii]
MTAIVADAADRPVSKLESIATCVAYGTVSISITLFNKAVFSVYNFNFPNIVLLLQLFISLVLLQVLRKNPLVRRDQTTAEQRRNATPMMLFWIAYVVSGVYALQHLNVPMFNVIRRTSVLPVLVGEYLIYNRVPSLPSGGAIALMVAGAWVAGIGDMDYNALGYFWAVVCVICTCAYLLLLKRVKESSGLSDATLLWLNNMYSFPLMLLWTCGGTNECVDVWSYPRLSEPSFIGFLLVSASQALLLNLAIYRCTAVNSALATTIVGNVKDVLLTTVGLFLFGDVTFNRTNLAGLGLGLAGGISYSVINLMKRMPKTTSKATN